MAEISPKRGQDRSRSKPRSRKRSTCVDMTAMVDVAFLLLTFFVLTASMLDQVIIETVMPPKCEGPDCFKKIDQQKILTLILDEEDSIRYYVGVIDPEVHTTSYSQTGLRQVLSDFVYGTSHSLGRPLCAKVNNEGLTNGACWDPIVLIKPKKTSRYGNLIDALDEIGINRIPKYTIAPFTKNDSLLLAQASIR